MKENIREIGENVTVQGGRESIFCLGSITLSDIPLWLELLSDSIVHPQFTSSIVDSERKSIEYGINEISSKPEYVLELLHRAAFGDVAYGQLIQPVETSEITSTLLQNLHQNYFTASNTIIGAAGVEHDFLVEACEYFFKDMSSNPVPNRNEGSYQAGHCHLDLGSNSNTHIALGYHTGKKGSLTMKDTATMAVIQFLLGGGSSFSAGGPGKGMYSRIYLNILNSYSWVEMCNAMGMEYKDAHLFSIYGSFKSSKKNISEKFFKIIQEELEMLATTPIDVIELQRAKNRLRCMLYTNLEYRSVMVEELSRHLLQKGCIPDLKELCESINNVTERDISQMITNMLDHKPASAILGTYNQ